MEPAAPRRAGAAPWRERAARRPRQPAPPVHPADGAKRVLWVGRAVVGTVTLLLVLLMVRVGQLQTRPPEPIAALIDSQKSTATILARRATIEDRLGRPLALTRSVTQLFVDPLCVDDLSTFSERVGYQLGYDPAWVEQQIGPRWERSRYIVLDRHLADERLERLRALGRSPDSGRIAGLAYETRLVREYPQGELAGPIVGVANSDGGLDGLERALNAELSGTAGQFIYSRDARRRPLWIEGDAYRPPADGTAVRLSLDLTIQAIAEKELAAACEQYAAQSGEMIVMDPATGEILAMANFPSVDPGRFGSTPPEVRKNRAVTDTYEPGSTFKPFVWAKALEMGLARRDEVFDTGAGYHRFPSGRRLRDAHANGRVTYDDGLIRSSNIMMGMIGERMTRAQLRQAVAAWGFGAPTGSGLPGEVGGQLHPVRRWSGYTATSIPMGQEVSVTALQMARGFCALANDGLLPRPTIRLYDPADPHAPPPQLERVASAWAARATREVLGRAVSEDHGTGKRARSPLYDIWGKTGTAQVPGPQGGYLSGAYVGSFVGGAPVERPRIVVACVIHRPDRSKGYYGGFIAAPAARNVIEQTLVYLAVLPKPPEAMASPGMRLVER